MSLRRHFLKIPLATALVGGLALTALPWLAQQPLTLLNVSYDPTRELYVEFNQAFARHWKATSGQDVVARISGASVTAVDAQKAVKAALNG